MKLRWYPEVNWFLTTALLVALFAGSAFFSVLYVPTVILAVLFVLYSIWESASLFTADIKVSGNRKHARLLSLGDENPIRIQIRNDSSKKLFIGFADEVPFGFQPFQAGKSMPFDAGEVKQFTYFLKPVKRGEGKFGHIQVYLQHALRFFSRRIELAEASEVHIFPSLIHMQEIQLRTSSKLATKMGVHRQRKLGEGYEFEEIRSYVLGDDFRKINWKATARAAQFMTNQYRIERAQNVYMLLDTGRSMFMPFNGMSLLDHSVNSSLALANVVNRSGDKAGLIAFSSKLDAFVPAKSKSGQMKLLANSLYHLKESTEESDYEVLYAHVQQHIRHRSVLLLFSNFETWPALERNIPVLRRLAHKHILLVVFFENSLLQDFSRLKVKKREDLYDQLIAENKLLKKVVLTEKLAQYGVQSILTPPEKLSLHLVNRYLAVRAGGLI